jgi:hypothetical protein
MLCAPAGVVASGASCGGGGSLRAQADGGSSDGNGVHALGEASTADGPAGAEEGGDDAGDPCAADTGGTSGATSITAVWANEGGDKVTQDELRATGHPNAVVDSVWDGHCITTFGAKNEVVSFNVILEAATSAAAQVSVSLGDLTGPGGTVIRSAPRATDKLFDWTTTEAELFYVRYLQIKGLSQQAYGTLATWQEATFPKRAQCPGMTQAAPNSKPVGSGCPWAQRPVANKFYPDIAVPLELVPTFDIAVSSNQSIWADVYIPKTAPSGVYGAMLTILESGAVTHRVPVSLRVRNFALPDAPSAKTMLFTSYGDISPRYGSAAQSALTNQRLMAHRHRISLIGDDENQTGTQPSSDYVAVLDGSFFSTQARRLLHRHVREHHRGLHAGRVHERLQWVGDLVRGELAEHGALRLPVRRNRLHAEHADARDPAAVVGSHRRRRLEAAHDGNAASARRARGAERSDVRLAVQPRGLRRRDIPGRDDRRRSVCRRRRRRGRADEKDLFVQRSAPWDRLIGH